MTELYEFISQPDPAADWGPWHLDRERALLWIMAEERHPYAIPLASCGGSAAVLGWIGHVAGKPWASDAVIAGLVRALDDIVSVDADRRQEFELGDSEVRILADNAPAGYDLAIPE
jgi:hypothetical protein